MQEETLACCCVNQEYCSSTILWVQKSCLYGLICLTIILTMIESHICNVYTWKKGVAYMWQNWILLFFLPVLNVEQVSVHHIDIQNQVSSKVPSEALSPLYLLPLQQIKAKKVENLVRQIPVRHLMALYLVTMRYIGYMPKLHCC